MEIISTKLSSSSFNYHLRYLEIVNIMLTEDKMSNKEMEVLASFLSQEKALIEEDMFNGIVRKKVMAQMNIKPGGLGNHLDSLISKKRLLKNAITKRITIQPYLVPEPTTQGFRIKLINNG